MNVVPGLADLPGLRVVIQQYINFFSHIEHVARLPLAEYDEQRFAISRELTFPAWEDDLLGWLDCQVTGARQNPSYLREQSESFAHTLVCHFAKLHFRTSAQPLLGQGVPGSGIGKAFKTTIVKKFT